MKAQRLLRYLFFFISYLLYSNSSLYAVDYYWVGGSGNWGDINHWATSSGGNVLHNKTPGSGDDVYFDSNSFTSSGSTVVVNVQTAFCGLLSIKNTGYFTLNLPYNNTVRVFGSIDMDKINMMGGGLISCESSTTGNTIRTSGSSIPNIEFSNTSGGWTQLDSLRVNTFTKTSGAYTSGSNFIKAYDITVTGGASDFNGATVETDYWNVRSGSLSMNGSQLHVSGRYSISGLSAISTSGCKVFHSGYEFHDYASATHTYDSIVFLKNYYTPTLRASSALSANFIHFEADGILKGSWYAGYLGFTPSHVYQINFSSQISVNTLDAVGTCDSWINVESETRGTIATLNFSQANTSAYLRLRDISITGSSWSVSPYVTMGNVTGVSGTAYNGKSMYWVGGSGSWKDSNHWSLTDGGSASACIPGPLDTVYFTNNSGVASFTVDLGDSVVQYHSLFAINSNVNISFAGNGKPIQSIGSFELSSFSNWNVNKPMAFYGTDTNYTIKSSRQCLGQLSLLGGGKWTLSDTLCADHLSVVHGKLDASINGMILDYLSDNTNEWNIGFRAADQPELDIDSSLVVIKNQVQLRQYGFKLKAEGSRVNCSSNVYFETYEPTLQWNIVEWVDSNGVAYLDGSEKRIYQLILNSEAEDQSNLKLDTLTLAKGKSYKFSSLVKFKKINAVGGCNDRIVIRPINSTSSLDGSGYANDVYYGLFENINFSNGTLNALNSFDLVGNSGINFVSGSGRTLYWVGGNGDWDDSSHWSLSSGGAGGECIPTPADSVVFDNSSASGNMTLEIGGTVFAHDFTAFNTNFDLTVTGSINMSQTSHIEIFGNVWFSPRTKFYYSRELILKADTGSFVFKTSNVSGRYLVQDGNAEYTLIDTLNLYRFDQNAGKFFCDSNHVDINYFTNNGGEFFNSYGTMQFDYLYSYSSFQYPFCEVWVGSTANLSGLISSENSKLIFTGLAPSFTSSSSDTISQVIFEHQSGKAQVNILSSHVSFMQFNGWAYLNRSTSVDSCVMGNGNSYFFNPYYQHNVYKYWDVDGDFCNPILLRSQNQGIKANVFSGDTVSADFLEIRDLNYSGASVFYTGQHSVDQGNNSGFIWSNKPGYIFGLGENINAFRCGNNDSSGIFLTTKDFQDAQSFLWSDSSTASSLFVNQSGTYWCTANYGTCQVTDTIRVEFYDTDFGIVDSSGYCGPTVLKLESLDSVAALKYDVLWSTGDTTREIQFALSTDTVVYIQIMNGQQVICTDTLHLFVLEHDYSVKSLNLLSCATRDLQAELIKYLDMPAADSIYFDFSAYDSVSQSYYGMLRFTYFYGGCDIVDSINLNYGNPFPILPDGGLLCEGSTVDFRPFKMIGGFDYKWNTGNSGMILSKVITTPGKVILTVTDDWGNSCSDSVEYGIGNPVSAKVYPNFLSGYQPYQAKAEGEGGQSNYSFWKYKEDTISTGDSLNFQLINEGMYEVYFVALDTLTGCYSTDTLIIQVIEREAIWIPNTFSPDGDGVNDYWAFSFGEHILGPTNLKVFNRWGELLFESNEKHITWDGRHKGREVQAGIYVYLIVYKDQGKEYKVQGMVNVLR